MSQIFISYSRSDKSIVDEFINQLEAAGHPVWVDREGIRGGEQWRQQIVEAIEQNDVFLLILSNNSIESDHVRTEVDLAKESKKRIIPVDIQPIVIPTTMKYQLAGLQRINMYSNYEDGFQELLATLGGIQENEPVKTEAMGQSTSQDLQKSRSKGVYIAGIMILVILISALAYLFSNNFRSTANISHPTLTPQSAPESAILTELPASEHPALHDLTTVEELEPLLLQANIRLSAPENEQLTRSYFTGPDSAYHKLAVAALTVVGDRRFSQPIYLDIMDKYYSQLAGAGYGESGPLDLEKVKESLVDAHNDYYGDNATSLEELFGTSQAIQPTETHPNETLHPAPTSASSTEAPSVISTAPASEHPALDELTTIEELEPLLLHANIRLSEPVDEERTRSYFTGPDSAYHMLAVASLTVLGEQRFIQPVNLDIVDKWYTQAVGTGYEERGPLDLEIVKQSLIDAHNDYWGDNATSLDELLEPLQ
jgi:hypothetical protein